MGSIGLKDMHIDLLGRVIFCTGVSPLKSYMSIDLSMQDPQRIFESDGLYLTLSMVSMFHYS